MKTISQVCGDCLSVTDVRLCKNSSNFGNAYISLMSVYCDKPPECCRYNHIFFPRWIAAVSFLDPVLPWFLLSLCI